MSEVLRVYIGNLADSKTTLEGPEVAEEYEVEE